MFKRQGELRVKKKEKGKHNYSEEQAESNIRNTFKNCSRVSLRKRKGESGRECCGEQAFMLAVMSGSCGHR